MLYRNDCTEALYACERGRTGNYGDDEFTDNPFRSRKAVEYRYSTSLPKGFKPDIVKFMPAANDKERNDYL